MLNPPDDLNDKLDLILKRLNALNAIIKKEKKKREETDKKIEEILNQLEAIGDRTRRLEAEIQYCETVKFDEHF